MKKYQENIGREKFWAFQQDGGGREKSYADTIPEMAPNTERESGSPTKKILQSLCLKVMYLFFFETFSRRRSYSTLDFFLNYKHCQI